ncbi:helix-turn-helix domain-containing protein, partial [Haloarcula nitratireducens]
DAAQFKACCRDAQTIEDIEILTATDDEFLCRMRWVDEINLPFQMVTAGEGTLLDAFGADSHWHLRVLYPSREHLQKTKAFCAEHEVSCTIDGVHELADDLSGRYGLTARQYDALITAVEQGYFEVPREITLNALADELDMNYQTLSECLRRGTETLVKERLLIGHPDEADRPDDPTSKQPSMPSL